MKHILKLGFLLLFISFVTIPTLAKTYHVTILSFPSYINENREIKLALEGPKELVESSCCKMRVKITNGKVVAYNPKLSVWVDPSDIWDKQPDLGTVLMLKIVNSSSQTYKTSIALEVKNLNSGQTFTSPDYPVWVGNYDKEYLAKINENLKAKNKPKAMEEPPPTEQQTYDTKSMAVLAGVVFFGSVLVGLII